MKAIVLEANKKLSVKIVPNPQTINNECLIKVKYAGICNSDYPRAYSDGAYFYPLIMGHEFSGTVEKAGLDTVNFKEGDRVSVFPLLPCKKCEFCETKQYAQCKNYNYYGSRRDGAFAEYISVPEWNLFIVPDGVDLKIASLMEPISVAFHAVQKINPRKGDRVAVYGGGLIGFVIARYLSETLLPEDICIIDRNDYKLSLAKKYGINTIHSEDKEKLISLYHDRSGGLDHVIEVCGSVDSYKDVINIVKSHGNLVLVGNIQGDLKIDKKLFSSILRREIKIYGAWNSKYDHSGDDDWNRAISFLNETEGLTELISHSINMQEAVALFKNIHEVNGFKKTEKFFKAVICI